MAGLIGQVGQRAAVESVAPHPPPSSDNDLEKQVEAKRTELAKNVEVQSRAERIAQTEVQSRHAAVIRH
eukprot:5866471-Pyramimonas_sp.AAC.1